MPLEEVFVVRHPKLWLEDPEKTRRFTKASARYCRQSQAAFQILHKTPYEIYEIGLTPAIEHVLESAQRNYAASGGISGCKVELVLAYPSGWDDYIHKRVAMISARVLKGAFAKHDYSGFAIKFRSPP